jgi:ribosomal-protein-alanine N-acetyltransferase
VPVNFCYDNKRAKKTIFNDELSSVDEIGIPDIKRGLFMALHVRPMQNDDVDSVYAIEMVAHRDPWSHEILRDCVFVNYDCRILEIDRDVGRLLAGYVISRHDENSCHILNLCVSPTLRNNGYGQFLLQNVIDSQKSPIEKIRLEVRPSNFIALQLYKKMGFEQKEIKHGYYQDSQGVEDGVVLEKKIIY